MSNLNELLLANPATLKDRHNDLTRRIILGAGLHELESGRIGELTMRSVAREARMSERTVFRYFSSRDELLDALALEVSATLELPPLPASLQDLVEAPRRLYRAFESHLNLTRAALHSELSDRIRESVAKTRWKAVKVLIDQLAPHRSDKERMYAAANIRYFLSASSWQYYRFYFGFSLKDSIASAEQAVRQTLASLDVPADR